MKNKVIKNFLIITIFLSAQIFCLFAWADTPIFHIDQSPSNHAHKDEDSLPLTNDERITQLERKVEFINRANLVEDMQNMRKKIQQLEGLLEIQTHTLEQLAEQQKKFYMDIDRRLSQSSNLTHPSPSNPPPSIPVLPIKLPEKKDAPIKEITTKTNENLKHSPSSSSFIPLIPSGFNEEKEKKNTPNIDKTAYEDAYHLMVHHQYAQAISAFSYFITHYPKSSYVANAHYWLGEIYIQEGNHALAMNEFTMIKNNFSNHDKAADAKYKIGILRKAQGNLNAAQDEFKELVKNYHGTSASQLAAVQLRHLT